MFEVKDKAKLAEFRRKLQREKKERERQERIEDLITWYSAAWRAGGRTEPPIDELIEKWRSNLQKKTAERIQEIHNHEKEIVKRHQWWQKALDEEQFFSKPDAIANLDDLDYWSKMDGWRLEEAVALSFGKKPEVVNEANLAQYKYKDMSFFVKRYADTRELVLRAKDAGKLSDPVWPKDFLAWAKKKDINVPPELVERVKARSGRVADWKARFEALKTQYDEEREANDQQIAELTQQLDALRAQNTKLESRLASDPPLREKERNSLMKMVLGMAVDKYGYMPGADRNRATGNKIKSIPAAVESIGLQINPDTVRNYLKEAETRFGEKIRKS